MPELDELNNVLKSSSSCAFSLLSERGRKIFFPKKGIISQAGEAKGKKYNATIGIALDDRLEPMRLESIEKNMILKPKEAFSYSPSYGNPELRDIWLKKIKEKNPSLNSETSKPVVTCALTHALSIAGYLFIDKGDSIIMTDLFWENYSLVFEKSYSANFAFFRTFRKGMLDAESMEKRINSTKSKKKIILLNFPNNPSGYSPNRDEYESIIRCIKKSAEKGNKILVICDDAYFGLFYEKNTAKESIFAELAGLHKNILAVKVDGPTKEDFAWGLRVGFITFSGKGLENSSLAALEDKAAGAVRATVSNAPNISQSLLIKAYSSGSYEKEREGKIRILKRRYEKTKEILKDRRFSDYFTALPFNSGYFMCIKLNRCIDPEKLRKTLIEKYSTGVIASGDIIRIAFSSIPEKDIKNVFENIYKACIEVKAK